MSVRLINPYAGQARRKYVWLRGNLHAHSTLSDGSRTPQELIAAYAARGYHFLALSDHDRLADFKGLDPKGMILLRANEISACGYHVLHVGAKSTADPSADRQKVINRILAEGGLAILNHPNFTGNFNHIPYERLFEFKGYAGIEIFNGTCLYCPGSAYALDKWDRLLTAGRKIWGYAHDDCHSARDEALGWNVVRVPAGNVTPRAIMQALRQGCFYASSGVEIERIETRGAVLHLVAPNAQGIEVLGEDERRLAFVAGPELTFDAGALPGPFVRVQCFGSAGRCAWTQPFFIRGGLGEHLEKKLVGAKPVQRVLRLPQKLIPDIRSPLWQKAPASRVFYRQGDAGKPAAATALRALLTKTHLVLWVRSDEPQMDKLRTTAPQNSAGMWTDDSIEFFLDVGADAKEYYHLMANPAGHWWAGHSSGLARKLNCACQVARDAHSWTVQLAVPLAALKPAAKAAPGQRWGFHVCRNRPASHESCFWSWTGGSNHNPQAFGRLQF